MSALREAIKATLLYELRQTDAKGTVVCLTGAWGCGKTYLWKEIEADLRGNNEHVVGYVSLFGLGNLAEARTAVFNALVLDRFANDSGDAKKMVVRLGSWVTQKLPTAIAGVVNSHLGAEILTRNLDMSRMIPAGSILCLDDLERISSSFSVQDALGYANQLAEQRDCRVLVIMNEEHLDPRFGADQAGLIRAYRERVVRTYLKLETSLREVLPHLRVPKSVAPKTARLSVETLERAKCSNVRTFVRALENIARAQNLAQVELDEEDVRFLTALTAEHAEGKLKDDPAYYEFHPMVFELDRAMKNPERDADKRAFYKAYFDGDPYRPDKHLHGLVRNGYLAVQPYLDARNERVNPPPTPLGRLLRRVVERDHLRISDEDAAVWLKETEAILNRDATLCGDQISTLYTVASVVAQIAGLELDPAFAGAAEQALVSAARRGDISLKDRHGAAADTRLPKAMLDTYHAEVGRVAQDNFRERAATAIRVRDAEQCRAIIRDGLPESAEQFMDAPLLRELHATLANDRRFYFEVLSTLRYVVGEYRLVAARDRLTAYARASVEGALAKFFGKDTAVPLPDNSARFQLRALLRELGYDTDAPAVVEPANTPETPST